MQRGRLDDRVNTVLLDARLESFYKKFKEEVDVKWKREAAKLTEMGKAKKDKFWIAEAGAELRMKREVRDFYSSNEGKRWRGEVANVEAEVGSLRAIVEDDDVAKAHCLYKNGMGVKLGSVPTVAELETCKVASQLVLQAAEDKLKALYDSKYKELEGLLCKRLKQDGYGPWDRLLK